MVENEIAMGILRGDFKEEDTIVDDVVASPLAKDLSPQKRLVIKKLERCYGCQRLKLYARVLEEVEKNPAEYQKFGKSLLREEVTGLDIAEITSDTQQGSFQLLLGLLTIAKLWKGI
ncbi:casein lytic proteinase B3 [Actinidia rufa]|uniref:Casein lytic proteinase B3 n=1 Tax=Actinidia rufa TaxID=165716 RepID=A0A7J0DUF3_9ERIC|nr:casein lytic proteinase B3 [Actinidia rufa]